MSHTPDLLAACEHLAAVAIRINDIGNGESGWFVDDATRQIVNAAIVKARKLDPAGRRRTPFNPRMGPRHIERDVVGRLMLNRPVGLKAPKLIIRAPDGAEIRIRVVPRSGVDIARLAIEAPLEFEIEREEAKRKTVRDRRPATMKGE